MDKTKLNKYFYFIIPIVGMLFVCWYITQSTCDVVYSDYIRLIDSYLPDIYDIKKIFVPDILTRIPINYLERIINVELFGFSVMFDRILGAIGLGLAGLVFGCYCRRFHVGVSWFVILMIVMFSLNKWEMLLNGSGWAHFMAFVGFYYHEAEIDRYIHLEKKRGDRLKFCWLPWVIIIFFAGPYGASYVAVLILVYLYIMICEWRQGSKWEIKWFIIWFICAIIPLLLYVLSNSFVVEEYAGATGRSLWSVLTDNPTFLIRFLLKSFAGVIMGGEILTSWINSGIINNKICYLLGLLVVSGYLLALWLNVRYHIYEKTLMPMMLLTGGGINHILVFLGRYIFERESYALDSSRYTLQFQVGILGIVLTFAFIFQLTDGGAKIIRVAAGLFTGAILFGNIYTTNHELSMAPYRKEWYEARKERAKEVPTLTDEEFEAQEDELADFFEYWNGSERIRNAYNILYENHWNVFRE